MYINDRGASHDNCKIIFKEDRLKLKTKLKTSLRKQKHDYYFTN